MDASLYFANCEYFKENVVLASKGNFHSSKEPIQMVILDVSAWISIDLSGLKTLNELHAELIANDVQLAFACAKGPLRDILKRTKFIEKLGEQFMHQSLDDAIRCQPQRRSTLEQEQFSSTGLYGRIVENRMSRLSLASMDSKPNLSNVLNEEMNPMLRSGQEYFLGDDNDFLQDMKSCSESASGISMTNIREQHKAGDKFEVTTIYRNHSYKKQMDTHNIAFIYQI
jgi:hypothetical protein